MNRTATRNTLVLLGMGLVFAAVPARGALVQYFPLDNNVNNVVGGGVVATNSGATFTAL